MLFFLYGEDSFSSKEKLDQLTDGFIKKNSSSGLFVFDFSEKNTSESLLLESLKSTGLFSEKKLIVSLNYLENVPTENQKKFLIEIKKLNQLSQDANITLIFYEQSSPKKTTSFYKYLISSSKKQEFSRLSIKDLENWTLRYIKNNYPKISFSQKSLSLLVSYTGNNLYLLKNEIEKLANYKQDGEISEKNINELVKSQIESTVFQTIESLLDNNKKRALHLLHQQLLKGEDPFYILSMYVYQIRTLLKISSAFENGNTNPQLLSKETSIHPYVIQKSIPQIKRNSFNYLKEIYKKLSLIDTKAKTSSESVSALLDKFIIEI